MKRYVSIGVVFAGLLFGMSCNEWLYLKPEDGIIRQEYWKSKEDVHAAVMGVYASLLGNSQGGGYSVPELLFLWGEIRGDMISLSRLRTDFLYVINGDILPDNGICRWNAFYRTINYCNTVLEFASDVLKNIKSLIFSQEPSLPSRIYRGSLRIARARRSPVYGDQPLSAELTLLCE